ncbi:MAG: sigma-70 family RNA polymerase sigma factor [Myxococcales bacterium]
MESYRRYGPALLRKARRLLRNEEDARDALQGLFVDFLARGEEPRELPYLYRAITHRCLNLLRDDRNRARLLERESPVLAGAAQLAPDTVSLGLDALLKLQRCVDETVMETVVYRFVDEMGLEEIAEVMQVSRKTVQNRLARAQQELALLLGNTGGQT